MFLQHFSSLIAIMLLTREKTQVSRHARSAPSRARLERTSTWPLGCHVSLDDYQEAIDISPSVYLLMLSHSKFVTRKSSSSISSWLWIGPTCAPPRKFWNADRSAETCSVCTSTVTVARAVTRVTVELDESESTGGDLLRFARLLLRLLLLWGPLLWRVRLPLEPDDLSSSLAILSRIQTSESAGGVLCLQVELGNNSLFDPADDAVPGGGISSIFGKRKKKKKASMPCVIKVNRHFHSFCWGEKQQYCSKFSTCDSVL